MLNRPKYALNPAGSLLARELGHREIAVFRSDKDCPESLTRIAVPGVGLVGLMFRSDTDLIAVSRDGHCVCWKVDAETGETHEIWSIEFNATLTSFDRRLEAGRARFAVGDERGFVLLWDVTHDDPKYYLGHGHDDAVLYVRFDYQGNRLVTTGRDNLVAVWSCEPVIITPPDAATETVTADDVLDFFADEDGDGIPDRDLAETSEVSAQDVLDFFAAEFVTDKPKTEGEPEAPVEVPEIEEPPSEARSEPIVEPLSEAAVEAARNRGFVPPPVIRTQHRLKGSEGWPLTAAFSHDGTRLVTGGMDNGVYLWSLGDEAELTSVQYAHDGWISDLEWSEDDSVIVSASWDSTIGLFDAASFEPRLCFEAHKDYVVDLEFIGDDRLVSASYDSTIGVWNWKDPQLVRLISGHVDWVEAVEPLGDGFLSMSSDGTAFKWSADLEPLVTIGVHTGAGIEIGAPVDMSEWVDTTKLASYRESENTLPQNFAVRYRDRRSSGFSASSGKNAMSMLNSALDSEASEPPNPKIEPPAAKVEPPAAKVEPPAAKVEPPAAKVEPPVEPQAKVEPPAAKDEPVSTPSVKLPLPATRKLPAPSKKLDRPSTGKIQLPKPSAKKPEPEPPAKAEPQAVAAAVSPPTPETNRPTSRPKTNPGMSEFEIESDAVEEFEPPDHNQWEGASRVMKDAAEFQVRPGTSTRPMLDGEPSEAEVVDPVSAEFPAEPTPTAFPSIATVDDDPEDEPDSGPERPGLEEISGNTTRFGFKNSESNSATPSFGSMVEDDSEAEPSFPSNPTPAAFPSAISQYYDYDPDEPDPEDDVDFPNTLTSPPWSDPEEDEEPIVELGAENTRPRAEDVEVGQVSSSALDDVEALAADLYPDTIPAPEVAPAGMVEHSTAAEIWTERSVILNADGMGIVRPTQSRRRRKTRVATGADHRLRFKESFKIRTPHEWVYAVAVGPKRRSGIASCGGDNTVCVWDEEGNLKYKLRVDTSGLNAVAFSEDGRIVAAGGDDGIVHLWLLPTLKGAKVKYAKLTGHTSWITSLAFSSDGRRIVSGSYDATARVWDIKKGVALATLKGHEGPVSGVSLSRERILTAGHDGTVRIWTDQFLQIDQFDGYDMLLDASLTELATCWCAANGEVFRVDQAHPKPLLRHRGQARSIEVRDDGTIISAGEDGHAMVYAKDAREPHQSLRIDGGAWSVSSRRNLAVIGGDDGFVHVFEME